MTDRQTDGRTDGRTDIQTDRQTDRINVVACMFITLEYNATIYIFKIEFVCLTR